MFQSEPICILTAGPTIDGRFIEQQVIDDMAETYDPKVYNARINEEHWSWGPKYGSVLSVEKRDNTLWAILKPNSALLASVEKGQLLHSSVEITPNFADTGKSYLSGLALTDDPASLGTTEIHLSVDSQEKGIAFFSSGATVGKELIEHQVPDKSDDIGLLKKIKQLLSTNTEAASFSKSKENPQMDKETKALLTAQAEQMTLLTAGLTKLTASVEALGSVTPKDEPEVEEPDTEENTALSEKVDELSTKLDGLVEKLSNITDEEARELAGLSGEEQYL
ncbi:GPO family capsid scaffolding protein [Aliivibrio fischeri]|uniref:GPO family capsid scaffolding protein n=1 Tax=Aliivibrio fischeri TaxID=668 RepID=UPI00084CDCCA|nr:GPO family capsid scaffolding protein [Aliivibrio fischeri]OED52888.1 phage capsid protein [Aliivibrio fischeri]